MKQFLLLLLFIPGILKAQSATEPFKKANVILVTVEGITLDDAFQKTGQSLIDAGYTLDRTDEKFRTLQTNVRKSIGNLGRASASVIVRASLKSIASAVEIKLSGTYGSPSERPDTEIIYRGMKGSPFMVAFEQLDKAAKSVAESVHGQVKYVLQ